MLFPVVFHLYLVVVIPLSHLSLLLVLLLLGTKYLTQCILAKGGSGGSGFRIAAITFRILVLAGVPAWV